MRNKKTLPIGKQIAEIRLKRKMTQGELSKAIGVSLSTIKSIEYSKRNPGAPIIQKLCAALNCVYEQKLTPL